MAELWAVREMEAQAEKLWARQEAINKAVLRTFEAISKELAEIRERLDKLESQVRQNEGAVRHIDDERN